MPSASTLKRLAVAAAVGRAALAATPALASAASTCTYNTSNKNVVVADHSGTSPVRIFRTPAGEIRIADGGAAGVACSIPGTAKTATVTNTDRVAVFATAADDTSTATDGYHVDQTNGPLGPGATPETDGYSEVEVQISAGGGARTSVLRVTGTSGDDEIRAGAGGAVNLSSATTTDIDQDVDVSMTARPGFVELFGRGGDDLLAGFGNEITHSPGPADGPLKLFGGFGDDLLAGGSSGNLLEGQADDDRYLGVNHVFDRVIEALGEGTDLAEVDAGDLVEGEVEKVVRTFP